MTFYSTLAEAVAPLIAELGRPAELVSYGPDTLGPNGMTRGAESVQQIRLAFGKQRSAYSPNGNATHKMRTAYISSDEDQLIRANQLELVEAAPAKPRRKLFADAAPNNPTEAK